MLDLHTCRSFYHYKSDFCRLMKQTKLLGEFLWGESKEIVTKLLAQSNFTQAPKPSPRPRSF